MGNQDKYAKRNNRLPDGTKKRKSSDRHKKPTQLEKDRKISRDERNEVRRLLYPSYLRHSDPNSFHVIFIEAETANAERILCETTELENGTYVVELPVLSAEEVLPFIPDYKTEIQRHSTIYEGNDPLVNVRVDGAKRIAGIEILLESLNKNEIRELEIKLKNVINSTMKKIDQDFMFYDTSKYKTDEALIPFEKINEFHTLIKERFGIDADDINVVMPNGIIRDRIIVVRGARTNETSLKSFVFRTYNPATWFNGPMYIQMGGSLYYNGALTDTYLASIEDLGNIVISTNMLCNILDYRVYAGKINEYDAYIGSSKNRWGSLLFDCALTDPIIMTRLAFEEAELRKLLYGGFYRKGPIVQDINKFLHLNSMFKDQQKRASKIMAQEEITGADQEEISGIVKERGIAYSKIYNKRKPQ